MVYVKDFEDFEIGASQIYMEKPESCRYTMKYIHSKGYLLLKVTNNVKCLQYKAEHMPDLKKVERFTSNLMGHMASKD